MADDRWLDRDSLAERRLPHRSFWGVLDPWPDVDTTYEGLVSFTEPSSCRKSNGRQSGVYFLIKDKVVVYVGQSMFVRGRIKKHEEAGKIPFDEWRWTPCSHINLLSLEAIHIHAWLPQFNGDTCAVRGREAVAGDQ
jgi:hypothetical protein